MSTNGSHGRRPSTPMVGLTVLRQAGDEGVTYDQLVEAVGPDVENVIAELRSRGHVIQTTRPTPGRVILHEHTPAHLPLELPESYKGYEGSQGCFLADGKHDGSHSSRGTPDD